MIPLEVSDRLSPALRYAADRLDGPARVNGSMAMGEAVRDLCAEHLSDLAQTRHDTANRLGAAPSGFLAQAADAAAAGVVTADGDGVNLSMRHPAIARAFRSITIEPKEAESLAIPIDAMAYNRRPAQMRLEGYNIFRLGGKGQDVGKNILATRVGDSLILLYVLVRSVTQQQDRSLMPSDDRMATAAAGRLTTFIHQELLASGLRPTST